MDHSTGMHRNLDVKKERVTASIDQGMHAAKHVFRHRTELVHFAALGCCIIQGGGAGHKNFRPSHDQFINGLHCGSTIFNNNSVNPVGLERLDGAFNLGIGGQVGENKIGDQCGFSRGSYDKFLLDTM